MWLWSRNDGGMIKLKTLLKEIETENIPYDYFDQGVVRTRKPIDPSIFQIGKYYSDGDVLRYIMSQHEDFEDDDRVSGVFKCVEMNPKDIEESEWNTSDGKIDFLSKSNRPFPPIILNSFGWIIDGGHRLESAKLRGDKKIKVLIQT